jgi:hypothetical protein
MWSTEASLRARLNGSLYDVDAVAISPMCCVDTASADSSTVGSRRPDGRRPGSPNRAGESARNSESNLASSATLARC